MSAAVPLADEACITDFAPALLEWFDRAGRKHLPWQQSPTSYRVWISEIMLQQTQVTTVIPYYERFMQRFPNVRELAAAPLDEVLHLWTGLGYYARARNLHRAATVIASEFNGEFPRVFEQVLALPGIGRSTAGAILALSTQARHPILDGNVKRVLTRYFGIAGFPGLPNVEAQLWHFADRCTPSERVAPYTQAIMDLGATLCVRSRPLCLACPLSVNCVARREGTQSLLPTPRPKKARPRKRAHVLIAVRNDGTVLLEQRPPTGIWGGLWTLPQFDTEDHLNDWLAQIIRSSDRISDQCQTPKVQQPLAPYHHSFTHFDLELLPHVITQEFDATRIAESERYRWFNPSDPMRIGLAKPTVDFLRLLFTRLS
jgi:A/G-specific adenine glycosylase